MTISKNMFIGAVAAAMVFVSGAAAMAATIDQPANVKASIYSNAVVDTVYPGEWVSVGQCYSGYCYINHKGPDGWVQASAIDWNYGGYPDYSHDWDYYHQHHEHHDHHDNGDFSLCLGNWNGHLCIAN